MLIQVQENRVPKEFFDYLKCAGKGTKHLFAQDGKTYLYIPGTYGDVGTAFSQLSINISEKDSASYDFDKSVILGSLKEQTGFIEEHPKVIDTSDIEWHKLDKSQIGKLLEASDFVSYDKSRYPMNGIFISPDGTLNAIDGRICYVAKGFEGITSATYNFNTKIAKKMLIDRKVSSLYLGTKSQSVGEHSGFLALRCILHNAEIVYVNRLIEGQFPNCKKIIPDDTEVCHSLGLPDAESWKDVHKRIVKMAESEKQVPAVAFSRVDSETAEAAYSEEKETIKWYGFPENFRISFEAIYFNQILNLPGLGDILYENPDRPVKAVYKNDTIVVLMPFR